jgi:hypothetical protein
MEFALPLGSQRANDVPMPLNAVGANGARRSIQRKNSLRDRCPNAGWDMSPETCTPPVRRARLCSWSEQSGSRQSRGPQIQYRRGSTGQCLGDARPVRSSGIGPVIFPAHGRSGGVDPSANSVFSRRAQRRRPMCVYWSERSKGIGSRPRRRNEMDSGKDLIHSPPPSRAYEPRPSPRSSGERAG